MNRLYLKKNTRGFTLAEVLMTVAIVAILAGIVFLGVFRYLRVMAQLERDGVAKEIFVSAQNHLTMAEGQGYLGKTNFGISASDGEAEDPEICYYVVNRGEGLADENSVLSLMLPFAAVEENVRVGGSYILRYQREPALVLDVFYCIPAGGRFGHSFSAEDYAGVMALRDTGGADYKAERRNYGPDRAVIGWYGGEEAQNLAMGEHLHTPEIEVINAAKLQIRVTNPNERDSDAELKLIITGDTGKAQKAYSLKSSAGLTDRNVEYDTLSGTYTVTLDDITAPGMHFSELLAGDGFLPGENITVQAVAFNNKALTNIAYSAEKTANSLFADIAEAGDEEAGIGPGSVTGATEASVSSMRHLANLDPAVSNANGEGNPIQITKAVQTTDLDWNSFGAEIGSGGSGSGGAGPNTVSIFRNGENTGTGEGTWLPVSPSYALDYDGAGHSIAAVKVDGSGAAGPFGEPAAGSRIANLMLIDFDIASSGGNAGALAGTLTDTETVNVLARGQESSVSAAGGSAGGLIGAMEGGSLTAGAAALRVSGSGDAGGLIGTVSGSAVIRGCYTGGHTVEGAYDPETGYDVTSSGGTAGGLVGNAGGAQISACYSTCSVSGAAAAGGLVGNASGAIADSYAVGLVSAGADAPAGAFAGIFHGSSRNSYYLELTNENVSDRGEISYLAPAGVGTAAGITPIDADAASYSGFAGDPAGWQRAGAYDTALIQYYQGKYSLKTVTQLDETLDPEGRYFADVHYGDWPSPEILFENTPM